MGLWLKAFGYGLGMIAVIASAFIVYHAFFGPAPDGQELVSQKRVCPPQVSAPARAPGQPVDDVIGVRPGFSVADAKVWLLCRDEHFAFDFEQIWHTPVPANLHARQRMLATRPKERIALGLVGLPEHEIVYAVFQDIQYSLNDVTPTPAATVAKLTQIYGPPHDRKDHGARIDLWWMYAPDGKPLNPPAETGGNPISAFTGWVTGSWAMGQCEAKVKIDPLQQASWSDQCGVSIHAQIDIRKEDRTRIERYRIVSIDQARLATAVARYREAIGDAAPTR